MKNIEKVELKEEVKSVNNNKRNILIFINNINALIMFILMFVILWNFNWLWIKIFITQLIFFRLFNIMIGNKK